MTNSTIEELYEDTSYGHETEFVYLGKEYILQPEVQGKKEYLVIWYSDPNFGKRIAQVEIPKQGIIPDEKITAILSQPCFEGKSFLEIEKDITVTTVF